MSVKVTKIIVDINGKETALSVEGAKHLKEALDAIFPSGIMIVNADSYLAPLEQALKEWKPTLLPVYDPDERIGSEPWGTSGGA